MKSLKIVLIAMLVSLVLWNNLWTNYQWTKLQDTIGAYEKFIQKFPQSEYAEAARQRISALNKTSAYVPAGEQATPVSNQHATKEDQQPQDQGASASAEYENWQAAKRSHDINQIRRYRQSHLKGKYADEAKMEIVQIADSQWHIVANSQMESEVSKFVDAYPESTHIGVAKARVEQLRSEHARLQQEERSWQAANASNDIRQFRDYLHSYPNGKHAAEAKKIIVDIADSKWNLIANSRSESEINDFIKEYPESNCLPAAEARIQKLYDDYDWVIQEGTLVAYKRFLQRNPDDSRRAIIEKKLIDLEVAEIAAKNPGSLPPAQRTNADPSSRFAEICIENGTSYELTVRYSGQDSKKISISAGEASALKLPIGAYTVAASVSAANVRDYLGKDALQGGEYSSRFYIRSSFGLPSSFPLMSMGRNACHR
jgi:outer membrane protein assembly factor BamD (BamD/ComL family)